MSNIQNYVDAILEEAPALTEEKRDKLTQLFGGTAM